MRVLALRMLAILCLIVPAQAQGMNLGTARVTCADLGFTPGTERFGECVLKLLDEEENDGGDAPVGGNIRVTESVKLDDKGPIKALPGGYQLDEYEREKNSGCGTGYSYLIRNDSRQIHWGNIWISKITGTNCEQGTWSRKRHQWLEQIIGHDLNSSDVIDINSEHGRASYTAYLYEGTTPCAAIVLRANTRTSMEIDICASSSRTPQQLTDDVIMLLNGIEL